MNVNEFNKLEIAKSNLKLKILHRSLFILKKKFEIYKEQINKIYLEYKQNEINNPILTFSIEKFPQILNNICMISQIIIVPFNNYHELINNEFLLNLNKEKNHIIIEYLTRFVKENIHKYNQMYYSKKMKTIKNILNNKPQFSNEEIQVEFTLYDKKGNIKKKLDKLMEENKELYLGKGTFLIFENDIDILNSNKFIYSQTIPLIIAEYIENNRNLIIISLNNELNDEIKYYFDDDIISLISKLENVQIIKNNSEIKDLLLKEMNLEQKLLYYNNIIKEKKNNLDKIIELNELKSQLIYEKALLHQKKMIILKQSLYINKSFLISHHKIFENKKNKRIKLALEKIFNFYSYQYHTNGKLDNHLKNKDYMNLNDFYKFCIEFKLNLSKKDIIEIFKNTSSNENEINFEEFLFTLEKIANIFNKNKINEYEKVIKTYIETISKFEFKKMNEHEEKKNQKIEEEIEINKENNEDFFQNKTINIVGINYNKNELTNKLEEIKEELNELYNKSKNEKLNELYDYMDLDRPNDYKKKMLGFTNPLILNDKINLENKLNNKEDKMISQNIVENQNNININFEKENKCEELISNKLQIFKTQIDIKKKDLNNNFINEKNKNKNNEYEKKDYINLTRIKSSLNKINVPNLKQENNKRLKSAINNIIYKINNTSITKPFNRNDIYLNKSKTKRYGSHIFKTNATYIINSLKEN